VVVAQVGDGRSTYPQSFLYSGNDNNVWNEKNSYEIKMPAIPLEKVRYIGTKGQNIFGFEKMYIDGEETSWSYALIMCNDYFNDLF